MKRTEWICRTWIKTAEDGWTSEFDRFETKEEAMEHGRIHKDLIRLDDLERDFEVYEIELTPAEIVRRIRRMSGLSQAAFGKLYGIPLRTIQSWELEEREAPEYVIGLLERVVREDFGADGEEVAKEEPEKPEK